jgi:AbrB family looped-hinge helix DNA binding protein
MRTGFTSTITSKFQLTIPKAMWIALHVQRGDQILVWEQNGDIIGQPV